MATTRLVKLVSERTREGDTLWSAQVWIDGRLVDASPPTLNWAAATLDMLELGRRWPHVSDVAA